MTSQPVTLLVADDQDLIREALCALLARDDGIDVIAQARNGFEAVELAARLKPDVVIMDVRMPGLAGPDATKRIKAARGLTRTRVLILTTFEDDDVVRACMGAGADGFIGKGASTAALIDAIHAVRDGRTALSARAARAISSDTGQLHPGGGDSPSGLGELTPREFDVVKLVALGLSNEDIGRRLSISSATAKTHVRNAMRKLSIHDRAQLVALLHRIGLGS
ncbi:response regulator transcription factor [Agromyces tropicus]|uniref:Response regulator transcription factor n=1 Tax=Agromyces tropicus TaxID=555371 RepID=A0ABP5FHH9_9MICO